MGDRVLLSVDAGVADVRLNRPDKLNALDAATFRELVEVGEGLKEEPAVRAVVLSGEGRAFCAGLDFSVFQAMGNATPKDAEPSDAGAVADIGSERGRITHLAQQSVWVWRELPVPVIAAVSGPCLGGGLQIALGADLRIVHPEAKLSVLEARWALIPDMCGTWLLPRLVGIDVAKELTWTGRTVSGTEAGELGLATRVADDPLAAAHELARELAGRGPVAVRHGKRLLEASMSGERDVAAQFLDERRTMRSLIGSPDNVEAVHAYFEKRPPVFADPAPDAGTAQPG